MHNKDSATRARTSRHTFKLWLSAVSAAGIVTVACTAAGAAASGASARHAGPAATSKASSSFLACEVTDTGGIHDESFNESALNGALAAKAIDPSITVKYLSSTSTSNYVPYIADFIAKKCGIIVTVGYDMATATQDAAEKNPMQKFTIVDYSYLPQTYKNLLALHYDTNQDAFLGGYLAAAMSTTGAVGTFGGQNIPTVTVYMDGFVAGVRYYDQLNHADVKALGWTPKPGSKPGSLDGTGVFTNNFTDQGTGFTDAKTLMSEGADVIFPVAGAVGLGAAEAVKDAGKGYTMEWVDTDGCVSASQYCSIFITSVTKGIATSVEDAVLAAAKGTFKGGQYNGTLANGGVALSPYHDFASKIPIKVQSEITKLKAEIIAGKLSTSAVSYPVPS
jgi:basic membrane protein A